MGFRYPAFTSFRESQLIGSLSHDLQGFFITIQTVVGLGISEAPTVGQLSQHGVDAESQVTGVASQESIAACTTDLVGGQQKCK